MTYFDRSRVSPADRIWHEPTPSPRDVPLPDWQYWTDPIAAMPVGARPFFASGPTELQVVPFFNVPIPGMQFTIEIGQIAVIKSVMVWMLRGGTLDPPEANVFWSLNVDGVAIGDGFDAVYMFGIGGSPPGINGMFTWPIDVRISTPGTIQGNVTNNGVNVGSNYIFCGAMIGYTYSAELDATLDAYKPEATI